jgi:hypothetical protein
LHFQFIQAKKREKNGTDFLLSMIVIWLAREKLNTLMDIHMVAMAGLSQQLFLVNLDIFVMTELHIGEINDSHV